MPVTQAIREGEWFAMYTEYVHKAAQLEMFAKEKEQKTQDA